MVDYSRQEAAERTGVTGEELTRLVEFGILSPKAGKRFSAGDLRRIGLVQGLERSGIPLPGLADMMRSGDLSLDFLDSPLYERFAALSTMTFADLSARNGVPVELLMLIREAGGSALPQPTDLVREDELAVVPFIEIQVAEGFDPGAIERMLRVMGDSLRRIAKQQEDWWQTQVVAPLMARGAKPGEVIGDVANEFGNRLNPLYQRAFLALQSAHEAHTWTETILIGIEEAMARAGLRSRLERPPAMCFLDITGYTRLTAERGDEAAAALAATLTRLVQRTSVQHGGRPIKWLGDGVMFFFPDPGPGVVAALDMVEGAAGAGLPPAHVGLHAGPVLFQEGDYYGQTVNVAARIADYARPGEVLVTPEVVAASAGAAATFTEIGPVELKGVSGVIQLHAAHRVAS